MPCETPASLACIYHLVGVVAGCNPNTFKTNATGGSKAIGIVDAYDYPTAMADLNAFSTQFGLPKVTSTTFKVYFAGGADGCSGPDPGNNAGWEGEQALDIEMAHAMAPKATIILVQAQSSLFTDLLAAEDCASQKVAAFGGGEISNSWGGSEFSTEASNDTHFKQPNIVYFASTGDSAGTQWPSVSTSVSRGLAEPPPAGSNKSGATFGNFIGEAAWEDGGGGTQHVRTSPCISEVVAGGNSSAGA